MLEKKKKQQVMEETPKEEAVSVLDLNTSNKAPDKVYRSFDDFFHEYALQKGINLKWKDSVKKHLHSIGCLKEQSKWLDGIKNFGL